MTEIGNPPVRYRLPRRLVQLYLGLALYGASMAFMMRARLGSMPWDVFHQGITRHTRFSFGWIVVAVGAVALLLWVPLRQRPGIGTVSNVFVIALVSDRGLAILPAPHAMPARIGFLLFGIALNGLATAGYIGAALGPGPRDGLMTGLVARTGGSIRLVRTVIEVFVVLGGWALGGTFGVGTVLYALTIGPLVQLFLPPLVVRRSATVPHGVPVAPHAG